VSRSKKLSCTAAQPGVLMRVTQTTTANTSVLATPISTERLVCRRRKARLSSSIELGGRASVTVRSRGKR
jgi:hypothetical protein